MTDQPKPLSEEMLDFYHHKKGIVPPMLEWRGKVVVLEDENVAMREALDTLRVWLRAPMTDRATLDWADEIAATALAGEIIVTMPNPATTNGEPRIVLHRKAAGEKP